MKRFKRIFLIVTDSLGVGELEDAAKYGDAGANTLKHLSFSKPSFKLPVLEKWGIGNITEVHNVPPQDRPLASFGKMKEISVGKDTLTGHWELMGLKSTKPFPSFTEKGFPKALIDQLEMETGHHFIGNIAASGTEIIKDLGEEHLRTGALILYTSADSVLQIAANDKVTPLEELYRVCAIARKITLDNPEWMVGRIIARPFIGDDRHNFVRTAYRHDYAVKPFDKTVLDYLKAASHDVIAIGKINDIFDGEGITKTTKIKSNHHAMEVTIKTAQEHFDGLCFVNLVDFDALYGHRRDAVGYATCLEEFDRQLGELTAFIGSEDLLLIVADHGNDPVHPETDHTREHVPLLVFNPTRKGVNLGTRKTFADVGATIAENFQVTMPRNGTSFLKNVQLEEENHEN